MPRKKAKKVLEKDEIIEFFSSVAKGEEIISDSGESEIPNLTMRFKAAEILGKCYGMFSDKGAGSEEKLPVIISGEERIEG